MQISVDDGTVVDKIPCAQRTDIIEINSTQGRVGTWGAE